jgi:hypothetical protein
MPYTSARYEPPQPENSPLATTEGEPRRVVATDDQGNEWFLTENSEVGDWLRYIEGGGTIEEPDVPEARPAKRKR